MSSELFNLYEGIFWVGLSALILVFLLLMKVPSSLKNWSRFSVVVLALFGVSDFMQVKYGTFLQEGMMWLLIWKTVCVIGLVVMAVWYLKIRLKK